MGSRQFLYPMKGKAEVWTPTSATSDGDVLPHTWHYAGSPQLYTDAAKTTVAAADGDLVYVSSNQGSDTHDIVQAVAGNRPTLKTGILNGQPVFRYDGTDYLQGAFSGGLVSQPYTIFAVAKLNAVAVNDGAFYQICDGDDITNRAILRQDPAANPDIWGIWAGTALGGNASDSDWNVWLALFNGASSAFWHNGNSEASGDANTKGVDGLTIGADRAGNSPWNGDIAEILLYASDLSTADRNQVGQYLADKFNLTWASL